MEQPPDQFSASSRQGRTADIQSLLRFIHRVKVMLWARDYDSAQMELNALEQRYNTLLLAGERAEQVLRDAAKDVQKSGMLSKYRQLEDTAFKKYQRDYLLEIETISAAVEYASNTFHPQDFPVSPLKRTIDQLARQIAEGKNLSPFVTLPSNELRFVSRLESGFFATEIRIDNTRTEYRAYNLDVLTMPEGNAILEALAQSFGTRPNLTDADNEIFELPIQLRLFTSGALIEVTVYEAERFAVEITFAQDRRPDPYFRQVHDAIIDLLPPQSVT